jgi:hypothetical protein
MSQQQRAIEIIDPSLASATHPPNASPITPPRANAMNTSAIAPPRPTPPK